MMNELRRAYLENVGLVDGLPICLEVSPDFKLALMGIVAKQNLPQPTVTGPSMFMGLTIKVVDDLDELYRFVYPDAEKQKPFCIY